MKIKCQKCGNVEETNLDFFVKLIGGALPFGGLWAWTAYLFAGTGLALPICIAIIAGGVGTLVFKDQIVNFILEKGYKCEKCGGQDWKAEA